MLENTQNNDSFLSNYVNVSSLQQQFGVSESQIVSMLNRHNVPRTRIGNILYAHRDSAASLLDKEFFLQTARENEQRRVNRERRLELSYYTKVGRVFEIDDPLAKTYPLSKSYPLSKTYPLSKNDPFFQKIVLFEAPEK